ncbi:hypothetical protein LPJ63_004526 [Coemansia sp. RSA 2711]|nr:hypothetical protein LPJ63_004526 [Coemansia sp. RSA 2711]
MAGLNSYEAPADFEKLQGSAAEKFNLSAVEDKELWLLRVPDNLSLKHLEGLTIKHPKSARNGVVGNITAGSTSFQLISSTNGLGGEFKAMAEMNMLVPDDVDDDTQSLLTLLPTRCTEMLSVVEQINIPDSTKLAQEILSQVPPARPQPENMKLRFIPYGFYSAEEYKALANGKSSVEMSDGPAEVPATPKKRKKAKLSQKASAAAMDVDVKSPEKKAKKDKKDKKKSKKSKA